MTYDEADRIRRKNRKTFKKFEVRVQTYRVYVTFDCGHLTSFTLSRDAYQHQSWRTRRMCCNRCAAQEMERIEPGNQHSRGWL